MSSLKNKEAEKFGCGPKKSKPYFLSFKERTIFNIITLIINNSNK